MTFFQANYPQKRSKERDTPLTSLIVQSQTIYVLHCRQIHLHPR